MSQDDPEAEGVVATWYVRTGETVGAGQVVAEVMVEKVSNDLEAPVAGVVRLLVAEEQSVRQGDLIATIEA
jgi:pyruvate/2-oxoglutarate dehydrogenase complex dihydrolipoamide acyltransferase (E2) component